jgi:peptidoglycan/LPS O-acetylase OafA/YrhL
VRRAARVFPAYWFALAGAALLLAGTGSSHALRPEHIPILLTAQQDLVVTTPAELIPPAWTLGIEITFYAALPLLGLALVRWVRRPRAQLLACAGLFAGSIAFNVWVHAGGADGRWHSTLFGDLYAFAAGMGATVVAARFAGPRGLVVGFGAALVLLNALLHDPIGWTALDSLRDAPAALGFALLVVGLADSPVLGSAPLRWLGDRSFGLYLWHYPVIAALAVRGWMPSSLVGLLAIVLPVSLLAGHVSWVLLERPLAARARRLRRPVRRRTRWAPAPARA